MPSTDSSSPAPDAPLSHPPPNPKVQVRKGTAGRHSYPARPTLTRASTLRISHFPDRTHDATRRAADPEDQAPQTPQHRPLTTEGADMTRPRGSSPPPADS